MKQALRELNSKEETKNNEGDLNKVKDPTS